MTYLSASELPKFVIDSDTSYQEFQSVLAEGFSFDAPSGIMFRRDQPQCTVELLDKYKAEQNVHDIIYGKNKESNIVNISVKDDKVYIFKETEDGVTCESLDYKHWVLGKEQYNKSFVRLAGTQPFKWLKEYSPADYQSARSSLYKLGTYTVHNQTENFMVRNGHTYFKNMKVQDVSLLSFDIETTGLNPHASDAQVLLITNSFRSKGKYTSKTFCVNDYESDGHMIHAWSDWVTEVNPSLMIGHNIVMFDIPYLNARYQDRYEVNMPLGRDYGPIHIDERPKELRKDGSQSYTYHRISCFGRDIVDTFFLSIKADVARKYDSYRLKTIIAQEGMEEEGRQHYDAGQIKANWHIPEERAKIIAYGEADSRDPIKLFDLMIPSFFYLTPYIPKPFQTMIESATGSQLNSLMVRSYLQKDMSVAAATETKEFEGAISFGNPGIYKNVFKVDVASLYPSIMRHYKIYPKTKDTEGHFLIMLNYFTEERLKNKALAKETGDRYYDDLQNSQKICINSSYGFMGASGLTYNHPEGAAEVTRYGREIITRAVKWAEERKYVISNCDTDSISFCVSHELNKDEKVAILNDLNSLYPSAIHFEDDGFYKTFCVLGAKNYILYDGKKVKLKGSSIRDKKKEPALLEFIGRMIDSIIEISDESLVKIYHDYIKEAYAVEDIGRWCAKKTITKPVLDCATNEDARLNERKVYNAVKDIPGLQEGDKVYLYPCIISQHNEYKEFKNGKTKTKVIKEVGLKLLDQWDNDHDSQKLMERVVATTNIFNRLLGEDTFIDYSKSKNKALLEKLLDPTPVEWC